MTSPQGANAPMMSDAFMAFRLMMGYLDDLSLTIEPSTARLKTTIQNIDTGLTLSNVTTVATVSTVTSVTNVAQIGGTPAGSADSFIPDEMDMVWEACIRSKIV